MKIQACVFFAIATLGACLHMTRFDWETQAGENATDLDFELERTAGDDMVHGDFPADAKDAPTFFIMSDWKRDDFMPALSKHPSRVMDKKDAKFIVVGPRFDCHSNGFASLPKLEGQKYLIWTNGLHQKCISGGIKASVERPDFLFVGLDLRNHDLRNNNAAGLRGITMSPAFFHKGPTADATKPAQYHLTYRGQMRKGWEGSSSVRADLSTAFQGHHGDARPRKDVWVEFVPKNAKAGHGYTQADKDLFQSLSDTNFFINPHGDNRYLNGFATTLGSCAIPVVMSDGLQLPFGELIDWTQAAVFMSEKTAKKGADAILNALPQDSAKIQAMRKEACSIHEKYFSTIEIRMDTMLKAAAIRMTKSENAVEVMRLV